MVGRKRHIVVDTNGLLIDVLVTPASVQDRAGGMELFDSTVKKTPTLTHLWADSAYEGSFVRHVRRTERSVLVVRRSVERLHGQWREAQLPLMRVRPRLELVRRRWVVERTFGWLSRSRRFSRDYEQLPRVTMGCLWAAAVRLLVRRLGA